MRINSNEFLIGVPILKIRKLLSYTGGTEWNEKNLIEVVSSLLDLNVKESNNVVDGLIKEGYMEKVKHNSGQIVVNTIKGNALAIASAAKPILKKTANRKMNEFLQRVKQVNSDEYFLYKVKKVVVFGSYLGTNDKLSDIDIAIELIPKEENYDRHFELERERAKEAKSQGRSFNTYIDELFWPKLEVFRFLKSRSRSISLHDISDNILQLTESEIVFEDDM